MKVLAVKGHEAADIRSQVARVLAGLGNPEPPLHLEEVRELLRLDLQFYSSSETGMLRQVVNRLTVGTKQILLRPTLLWEAIKKADLSALWLPDKKRILIDSSKPKLKHRWSEAHEVIHSLIPWHKEMNLGDTDFTLRPACHEILEAEANFGAGELLFLQGQFRAEARDSERTLAAVKQLSRRYGNTITSTLWRYVADAHVDIPMVGTITQHPRRLNADFDPKHPCRYTFSSPRFRREFAHITEVKLFRTISGYCNGIPAGPLGEDEVYLLDLNGKPHLFHFESFSNSYEVLTLGVHLREATVTIAV